MDKDQFFIKLNDEHKGLTKGLYDDYDKDMVDTYKELIKSGDITVFHGFICKVSGELGAGTSALVPYTGSYQELREDPDFTEYHYWRTVGKKKECPMCGNIYFVTTKKDKEEESCPYCV